MRRPSLSGGETRPATADSAGSASWSISVNPACCWQFGPIPVRNPLGTNATLTQTYDELGRLTGQAVFPAAGRGAPGQVRAVQQRTFRYRADGQVTAIDDRLRGDRVYDLTPGGRVAGVRAATWTEQYTYDALGNLVTARPGPEPSSPAVLRPGAQRRADRRAGPAAGAGRGVRPRGPLYGRNIAAGTSQFPAEYCADRY
jgi:hypothetical protein